MMNTQYLEKEEMLVSAFLKVTTLHARNQISGGDNFMNVMLTEMLLQSTYIHQ